jgi:hypothetical protein
MTKQGDNRRRGFDTRLPPWRFFAIWSWAVGLAVVLGGIFAVKACTGTLPDFQMGVILAIGIPWGILPGILAVVHREVPRRGMPSIQGTWAVIQGVVGILVFGGLEIWLLYALLEIVLAR